MTLTDLIGAKVGVRAYSQTTGMWVRAILAGTYGIPTERITWVTFEEGHLAEYQDPSFVTRMPAGADMLAMLRAGELDAAIFGNDLPREEGIESLIPNPAVADEGVARHAPVRSDQSRRRDESRHRRCPSRERGVGVNLLKRGKISARTGDG